MIITSKVQMDLARPGVAPMVEAVQDDKYSRNLEISLYLNGAPWEVPSGAKAVIRYIKPDGTGGSYDTLPDGTGACGIDSNVVTVALAPQVCTVPGLVRLAASLIEGDAEISTFIINLNVHSQPGINGVSEDYINVTAYVKSFGWTPNMYLATDEKGNVVAAKAPEGGGLPVPDTAKVGQYIRVSGVDENGAVTAVEAVDVIGDINSVLDAINGEEV